MKSKLSLIFAFAVAASSALPFAASAEKPSLSADNPASGAPALGSSNSSGSAATNSSGVQGDLSLFQQLDSNKDGFVDQSEANKSAQTKSDLKAIDANGDAKISAEEWASYNTKR
ncbi:MAG: hypothetical protein V4568_11550 [Pseudomonadota bacterium]